MRELAVRPEEVPAVFAERFNSGDATALAQVYEDAAVLVPQPGTPVTGPDLHAANGRLQQLGVPVSVRPRHVYRNGDLALLIVDWAIDGTGRDGRVVHVEGTATDVARRGPDGRWRYVIDNPFGSRSQRLPTEDTEDTEEPTS
ncbi:YybH family protein [Streptomyces gamaensis]|uniref:YybH family protein n=1 Tax=Streptomyces gamaensis TaxID=1763542 RepID=A0ABW0YYK0_9ACTN